MSAKSSIEWTDVTWNPVRGCSMVSDGCQNCYAMKQAHRFSGPGQPYEGLTYGPHWTGKIKLVHDALDEPLHWKKPRKIFVNSMSDLFHRDVPHEFLVKVFAVMALTPQHTYQILTKRPNRMQDLLSLNTLGQAVRGAAWSMLGKLPKFEHQNVTTRPWPLPNVWLGVSVENQETADERIPLLLQTPAAVRFVSAEPLLGPVDFDVPWPPGFLMGIDLNGDTFDALRFDDRNSLARLGHLDWVVVGGESGPGARPCDVAWIRSIKDQCQEAAVPVFVKQLGANSVMDSPMAGEPDTVHQNEIVLNDKKGGEMAEWPEDLRVREFPGVHP